MTDRVLIVGAGPVGLTMALELARYGVPVRIIDKIQDAEHTSRAVAVWPRTLELLDRSGAAADLIPRGNKVTVANILSGGQTVASLSLDQVPSPYPFVLMVPQYDTETVLRQHLLAHGVTPDLGVELLDFEQDEDGVSARLRGSDGTQSTERLAFLVACDGAHSMVRHRLGLEFRGDTIGLDWTQGDFHLSGYPFPSSQMSIFAHPDGPTLFFPMAPDRARIITSLGSTTGKPVRPLDQDAFQKVLDARGPDGIKLTGTVWISAFRINERQVETYRAGRVFLAGDAAHIHSPAGGQGMNTGMQDAFNLAWKLALVSRGIGTAPKLLDSYDPERRPVGAQVIKSSGRMTRMATLANPVLEHLRDVVIHTLLGLAPVQRAMTGMMAEVSVGYPHSPLNGTAHGEAPTGSRIRPMVGETPFGAGHTPLFAACGGAGAAELASRFPGFVETRLPREAGFVTLVRPDGYLAAQAPEAEWQSLIPYLHQIGPNGDGYPTAPMRSGEGKPEVNARAERRVFRKASPTELVYIATRMIVVSRSRISGKVDRAQFEAAVGHLEARYGILRSVVEDGHFVERADRRSAVEAWLSADECSAEAMYATLLNADLDAGKTLYGIHVITGDDGLDVFMLTSHAVTDATSLIELHSCLAHICDCVVRGRAPTLGEQPFPSPVDEAMNRSLASLATDTPSVSYSGAYAQIPMRARPDGVPVTHRLERIVIEADEVLRIKTKSHATGSSVHSLLLAAFALAIRDIAEQHPRQILVRSSIDMRRRLEPHVSTDLVFTAITGHITSIPDLDRPILEIARLIFADIHQGVANGSIFHDYVNYPRAFGSPQQAPVAINVSDLQSVQFHWPTERLAVTGFEYALGWLKAFPNVSVAIYDGTLIANIVYVEEFAAPAIMRTISEGVIRRLEKACA